MKQRPSAYLEERCEVFERVLDNYLAAEQAATPSADDLLLFFSGQLPFWNTEIDALIDSFDDFELRAQSWQSERGLEEALRGQGLYVHSRALKHLKKKQGDKKSGGTKVVAPFARLNRVIEKWNHLLSLVNERLLAVDQELEDAPREREPFDLGSLRKTVKK
ncbi:MAG: hypothetical protein AB7K24_07425 [Gemmataceae bacterium]